MHLRLKKPALASQTHVILLLPRLSYEHVVYMTVYKHIRFCSRQVWENLTSSSKTKKICTNQITLHMAICPKIEGISWSNVAVYQNQQNCVGHGPNTSLLSLNLLRQNIFLISILKFHIRDFKKRTSLFTMVFGKFLTNWFIFGLVLRN